MYSTAAIVPASPSWFCVPVSHRYGTSSLAGRSLYGRHVSSNVRRTPSMPRCGPKNLYGDVATMSAPRAPRSIERC
jgi:hypothetical protein